MNKIVDEKRKIDTAKICELLNGMSEQEKTKIYYMLKGAELFSGRAQICAEC